jgi:hypothetical protein
MTDEARFEALRARLGELHERSKRWRASSATSISVNCAGPPIWVLFRC